MLAQYTGPTAADLQRAAEDFDRQALEATGQVTREYFEAHAQRARSALRRLLVIQNRPQRAAGTPAGSIGSPSIARQGDTGAAKPSVSSLVTDESRPGAVFPVITSVASGGEVPESGVVRKVTAIGIGIAPPPPTLHRTSLCTRYSVVNGRAVR